MIRNNGKIFCRCCGDEILLYDGDTVCEFYGDLCADCIDMLESLP